MTRPTARPMRHSDRLFVDGQWAMPSTDALIDIIAPASEEVAFSVAEAKEADIAAAVGAARRAFDEGPWPGMTHRERAEYLLAIARNIRKRADDMAAAAPLENGILHRFALASAGSVGAVFESYANLAETFPFIERHVPGPTGGGGFGLLVREPVGVVAAIVPWNGPALISAYNGCSPISVSATVG